MADSRTNYLDAIRARNKQAALQSETLRQRIAGGNLQEDALARLRAAQSRRRFSPTRGADLLAKLAPQSPGAAFGAGLLSYQVDRASQQEKAIEDASKAVQEARAVEQQQLREAQFEATLGEQQRAADVGVSELGISLEEAAAGRAVSYAQIAAANERERARLAAQQNIALANLEGQTIAAQSAAELAQQQQERADVVPAHTRDVALGNVLEETDEVRRKAFRFSRTTSQEDVSTLDRSIDALTALAQNETVDVENITGAANEIGATLDRIGDIDVGIRGTLLGQTQYGKLDIEQAVKKLDALSTLLDRRRLELSVDRGATSAEQAQANTLSATLDALKARLGVP